MSAEPKKTEAKRSWADEVDAELDDQAPPPGFESKAKGEPASSDDLAKAMAASSVVDKGEEASTGPLGDAPDLTLGKEQGLKEDHADEIKTEVAEGATPYTSAQRFEDLPLSPELLKGLYTEMKFERPSRIQASTLPMVLTPPYKHLIAQAHNGSGKTTCFVLSMLSRVDPSVPHPQALCVCPTRELAVQNLQVLQRMGKYTAVRAACTAFDEGPASTRPSIVDHVVIGTHGKLKNWMAKRRAAAPVLPVDHMKILVFDEADVMMDEHGQKDDSIRMIREIIKGKKDGNLQILLFSATFNDKVRNFVESQLPSANKVFVPKEKLSLEVIKQFRVHCPSVEAKRKFLTDLFPLAEKLCQTIVFVRTRQSCKELYQTLKADGWSVTALDGSMEGDQRDAVVKEFREGKTKIMVSTDVLSRGFDVSQISLVINFDPPVDEQRDERNRVVHRKAATETYMHRIGRSGRFGRKGAAFNLWEGDKEKKILDEIETHFQHRIVEVDYEDEDALEKILKDAELA